LEAQEESDYYRRVSFEVPEAHYLEVGGMTLTPNGSLMVCTRRGDVVRIDDPDGPPEEMTYSLFASGLQSPLGIVELDGSYYVAQLGELTRLSDTDGDGEADRFDTVCDDWGFSGNFHEFAYGPRLDREGFLWVTLNVPFGEEPYKPNPWRGWALRIDPRTGEMFPMAAGLRSPSGLEISPDGDVFFTDNQGNWCNANKLAHIERGDFHGHPFSLRSVRDPLSPVEDHGPPPDRLYMKDVAKEMPSFKMPAVWFPFRKAGRGPAGMAWDTTGGKFGPFEGQVFVTEFRMSRVFRVQLEKVRGHWQGAVYPFITGLKSAGVRALFSPKGNLLVGQTRRGWGSIGPKQYALERVDWTGRTPFEIRTIHARADGFELEFTLPIDLTNGTQATSYRLESYTYRLSETYGGPEEDKRTHVIEAVEPGPEGKKVFLPIRDLRPGYVYEFHVPGLRSADGTAILHDTAFYTLVNLP